MHYSTLDKKDFGRRMTCARDNGNVNADLDSRSVRVCSAAGVKIAITWPPLKPRAQPYVPPAFRLQVTGNERTNANVGVAGRQQEQSR